MIQSDREKIVNEMIHAYLNGWIDDEEFTEMTSMWVTSYDGSHIPKTRIREKFNQSTQTND
tara:strand:- start:5678 stop:5860 length:183 start_codon:yes stop_codon:yes gene_type:complete